MRYFDRVFRFAFVGKGNPSDAKWGAGFGLELALKTSQLHRLLRRHHASESVATHALKKNSCTTDE